MNKYVLLLGTCSCKEFIKRIYQSALLLPNKSISRHVCFYLLPSTSNFFSCVRFLKLRGGFMFVAWWVKLCQAEMFVVWMEKYQPDEPKRD